MLDLVQLSTQVVALSHELRQESQHHRHRVQQVVRLYHQWLRDPDAWLQPSTPPLFAWARPSGSPHPWDPEPAPARHRVTATDGSQLVVNHHEMVACWLLNVGLVRLTYGTGERPILRSFPRILTRLGELDPETALAWQRSLWELQVLAQSALESGENTLPQVALVDGSLLAWGLEGLPQEIQQQCLEPWLLWVQRLQTAGIPLVGYVSAPRSREVVGFLRLGLCEQPCEQVGGVQDRHLWAEILKPGQASPLWISGSRLNGVYGEQAIHACYVHGGREVIRLEFPAWLARERSLLQTTVGLILAQVEKGRGYPITLAEAHHLAVIRGSDRQRFLALVERELIRSGLEQVQVSPKQAHKSQTLV